MRHCDAAEPCVFTVEEFERQNNLARPYYVIMIVITARVKGKASDQVEVQIITVKILYMCVLCVLCVGIYFP
jgi:hypothetical protein